MIQTEVPFWEYFCCILEVYICTMLQRKIKVLRKENANETDKIKFIFLSNIICCTEYVV